jgi:hypothetical protein
MAVSRSFALKIAAMVALTFLMAGCGDGDPGARLTPTEGDEPASELDARLLGTADLPPGWEEFDPASQPEQTEQDSGFCGEPVPDESNATDSASVQFAKGELTSRMVETLVAYETPEQATEAFNKVEQTVGTCKQWDLDQAGTVSRFNLTPATFPNLADQTVAARVTSTFNVDAGSAERPATMQGSVTGDTVVVRYQNHILVLRHFAIGVGEQPEFSATDTEPATRRAVEKLMQAA